jgi:hypothetical protein
MGNFALGAAQSTKTAITQLLNHPITRFTVAMMVALGVTVYAHDVTTHVTWNREVSRIVFARCASCHRPGGSAFSLLTYAEANPWSKAIKETVLQRTMPPWGAVKGFGSFRNDRSLTQEEMDLFEKWVNGGAPEGNPNDLPSRPKILLPSEDPDRPGEITARENYRFAQPFKLDGIRMPDGARPESAQITIEFPDGRIEPLIWLHGPGGTGRQTFLLRKALTIPAGAMIRGMPAGLRLTLLPG